MWRFFDDQGWEAIFWQSINWELVLRYWIQGGASTFPKPLTNKTQLVAMYNIPWNEDSSGSKMLDFVILFFLKYLLVFLSLRTSVWGEVWLWSCLLFGYKWQMSHIYSYSFIFIFIAGLGKLMVNFPGILNSSRPRFQTCIRSIPEMNSLV